MNYLKKLLMVLVVGFGGIGAAAQEKLPYSYLPEINQENTKDFALSDYTYDNGSKIYYKIVNDNNSLGILIKMDKESSRELFFRGLEIWLNSGNKKKKVNGVKFPVPQQPDFSQGNNKGPKENAEMSLQSSELEITGFGSDKVQLVPSENTKSIRGKINLDDKDMIDYQVIIPFDVLKSAVEVNKSFSVLINWGEFKKPENGAPSGDRPPRPDMNGDQKPPMGDRPGPGSGPGDGKGPKMQELDIMVRDIIILKK